MGRKLGAFVLMLVGLIAVTVSQFAADWAGAPLSLGVQDLAKQLKNDPTATAAQSLWFSPFMQVLPLVLITAFAVFSMFNGRVSRWFALAYTVLFLGALVALLVTNRLEDEPTVDMDSVVYGGYVLAALLVVFAVATVRRYAWLGAVVGVVAAVVAGLSAAYAIVDQSMNGAQSYEAVAWLAPLGYALIAVACVLAIRAARAERSTPQTPASPRNETGVEPGLLG